MSNRILKTVTLRIEPDLWEKLKIHSFKKGITLSFLIIDTLVDKMIELEKPENEINI